MLLVVNLANRRVGDLTWVWLGFIKLAVRRSGGRVGCSQLVLIC